MFLLGFLFRKGADQLRAGSRSQLRREFWGRQPLVAAFRDRISARAFLPIQPCIQVGGAETPHFSYMGAVNLPTPSQLL